MREGLESVYAYMRLFMYVLIEVSPCQGKLATLPAGRSKASAALTWPKALTAGLPSAASHYGPWRG